MEDNPPFINTGIKYVKYVKYEKCEVSNGYPDNPVLYPDYLHLSRARCVE